MTSEIKLFNYGDYAVRAIEKDGEVWIFAKDVCDVLELTNPTEALRSLDDDEKMTLRNSEGHSGQRGGAQSFNVISEAGVYTLTMRSKKPEAKKFRRWVTHEVIPQVMKTGSYSVNQEQSSNLPAVCEQGEEFQPKLDYLSRGRIRVAIKIFEAVFNAGEEAVSEAEAQKVLALDKLFEASTGRSALEIAGIKLTQTCETFHDDKRNGTWYVNRHFVWKHNFPKISRDMDFMPDDDEEFRTMMSGRILK